MELLEFGKDRAHGDKVAALTPSRTYLGINVGATLLGAEDRLDEIPVTMTKIKREELSVLIATLPDPLDTGSKFEFDMAWRPSKKLIESEWIHTDRSENPTTTGSSTWRAGAGARTECYRSQPACLLFRSGDTKFEFAEKSKLMVLLIVGESPTWGIQKGAFETSLDIAGELTRRDAKGRRTIKVIGPTYSGTAASLGHTLSSWLQASTLHGDCDAWVCSGSATSVNKKQFEELATPANAVPDSHGRRVIYTATVLPDEVLLDEVFRYLAAPGTPPNVIRKTSLKHAVLLVEGGTLYGNRFFRYIEQINQNKQIECLFIPFPRRISQLRAIPELTQGFQLSMEQKSTAAIPLAEKGERMEIFPSFDPEVTGPNDSLVLKNILATIANEDVRYVGVLASEVRNVLFLVKLINRYCPDVQIFLINNDVMFSGEDFSTDFYGTIIASTYPVDSRSPVWSFPGSGSKTRRLFSNEIDIGRYNACLALINGEVDPLRDDRLILMGQAEDMLVYGPPFESAGATTAPLSFGIDKKRPCVWINIVGKDSVWPVQTVSLKAIEDRIPRVFNKPINTKKAGARGRTSANTSKQAKLDPLLGSDPEINVTQVDSLAEGVKKRSLKAIGDITREAACLAMSGKELPRPHAGNQPPESRAPVPNNNQDFDTEFEEATKASQIPESQISWVLEKAKDCGMKRARAIRYTDSDFSRNLPVYTASLSIAFDALIAKLRESDAKAASERNSPNVNPTKDELRALFDFQAIVSTIKSLIPDGNQTTSVAGKSLAQLEMDALIFGFIVTQVGRSPDKHPAEINDLFALLATDRKVSAGHLLQLWQDRENLDDPAVTHPKPPIDDSNT